MAYLDKTVFGWNPALLRSDTKLLSPWNCLIGFWVLFGCCTGQSRGRGHTNFFWLLSPAAGSPRFMTVWWEKEPRKSVWWITGASDLGPVRASRGTTGLSLPLRQKFPPQSFKRIWILKSSHGITARRGGTINASICPSPEKSKWKKNTVSKRGSSTLEEE